MSDAPHGVPGRRAPGHEIDCSLALRRVHEFLDNELDEADAQQIREHLAACEECLDDFDAEQALKQLVKRCHANDRAPEELRSRIRASLAAAQRRTR